MPTPMPQNCAARDTEIERGAFNAAFYELGLRWHWDGATYEALSAHNCERGRVRRYLEAEQSHLLRAYDAEFLTDAILVAKRQCQQRLASGSPGTMPRFDWAAVSRFAEVGI